MSYVDFDLDLNLNLDGSNEDCEAMAMSNDLKTTKRRTLPFKQRLNEVHLSNQVLNGYHPMG